MATAEITAVGKKKSDLFDNAICLSLQLSKPTNRRAGDLSQVTTDADHDWLGFSKKLFEAPEWKAIVALDRGIVATLRKYTLKSPLRSGVYLLPLQLLEIVDAKVQAFKAERAAAIATFLEVYPAIVQEAGGHLRSQYAPGDYPEVEAIEKAFAVEEQYITFSTPGSMSSVSRTIYERAKQQAEERWQTVTDEIQQTLRAAMRDLIAHAVDRLTPKPDGSRKMILKTSLDNLCDFLDTFRARNLTDDAALDELVEKAKAALDGKGVEQLKDDESFRKSVQEQFSEIGAALDTLAVDAPKRKFKLDE